MLVGIFDLEHVKVIWGHSVQFSEKAKVRKGQNLGLGEGCVYNMHVGIFYL